MRCAANKNLCLRELFEMDKFRRMEILVAVVEAGQLTRAAKELHLSKAAVSHSLNSLEEYLDIQLLTRNNRIWQLTEAGSTYYHKSKKILADIETIEDNAQKGSQNLSGLIRISSPGTFGSYVLPPIISKFMEIHPNILIELNLMDVLGDLLEQRVDIAFRAPSLKENNTNNNKLERYIIGDTEMVICASPEYLRIHGTPKSHLDIKKHKCIMYPRTPVWRLSKNGRRFEYTPTGCLTTDNAETMREFCIHGQGVAFMSSTLAEAAIKKRKLVPILQDYETGTVHIEAIRIKDKYAPARVVQLLHFILNELRVESNELIKMV